MNEITVKKRAIIRSQARNIVSNVIKKCEEEKKSMAVAIPLCKSMDRSYYYTGIPKRTLHSIKKQSALAGTSLLKSPTRKGKKINFKRNINIDEFDLGVIKKCIEDFYLVKKIIPTCPLLLFALREKIEFPWGLGSLRKVLKRIGYEWQKCNNKRKLLVEKSNVVYPRNEYLRKMRQYRKEGRQIFYVDERLVDNNLTFKKCWSHTNKNDTLIDSCSSHKLIVIHAVSRAGFLNSASLFFKAGTTSGDYHGQMNAINYEKWVNTHLLPNLPPKSVVVIDNAPYHNEQQEKIPTKSSLKRSMIEWLTNHNIPYCCNMRKDELFKLVQLNKPMEKKIHVDEIIKSKGHSILRSPTYMCELNPIERAYSKIKWHLRKHTMSPDTSLTHLQIFVNEALALVTDSDWEGYEDDVIHIENEYWIKDGLMENAIEEFAINLGVDTDGDDVDNDDHEDDDDDEEDDEDDDGDEEEEYCDKDIKLEDDGLDDSDSISE